MSCSSEKQVIAVFVSENLPEEEANIIIKSLTQKEYPESKGWQIDNKYYKTYVNICMYDENFADLVTENEVEAAIVFFNSKKDNLKDIELLTKKVDCWSPSIKLMICESLDDDKDSKLLHREPVINLCLKQEFELIEMKQESEDFEEDDYGVCRLKNALEAHTWPQMILKSSNFGKSSTNSNKISTKKGMELNNEKKEIQGSKRDEKDLESDLDSFDDLMSKMYLFKEQLHLKSREERLKFAEDAVTSICEKLLAEEDELL